MRRRSPVIGESGERLSTLVIPWLRYLIGGHGAPWSVISARSSGLAVIEASLAALQGEQTPR